MTLINVNVSSMVVPHMDEYTSGASNSFYVKFTFSPEWDDLTKLVSFKAGSTIVSQIMSGDTIAIPHEVLKPCTSLYVGVLGTQGETVVLPTIWKELRKVKYGAEEGTFPVDPTPSQYQQILSIAQSVRDDANAGRFDGEDGVSITNTYINNRHLIVVLSNGTELDAGEIPSGGTYNHDELDNRDIENAHPISAITGLSFALESKQDTISDLGRIREGAALGETAVQPLELQPYRTATDQNVIDNQLQGQIDAITTKSDVSGVVGTHAELVAIPEEDLFENDIYKVLADETLSGARAYYKWTGSEWELIGTESPSYTKSEADALFAQKQNNLTAGTGISIVNGVISCTYPDGDTEEY